MTKAIRASVMLSLLILSPAANARGVRAVRALEGYKCQKLNITDDEARNPTFSVPIRAEPSANGKEVATASGIVLVSDPVDRSDGYVRVLRLNGQEGWIQQDILTAWTAPSNRPDLHCIPSEMSDGKPGFAFH